MSVLQSGCESLEAKTSLLPAHNSLYVNGSQQPAPVFRAKVQAFSFLNLPDELNDLKVDALIGCWPVLCQIQSDVV